MRQENSTKRAGKVLTKIKMFLKGVEEIQRNKASSIVEAEMIELENIFMVLLFGSLIGLPSPPTAMAVELLPHLEKELQILISRADMSQDPLGYLVSILELD